MGATSRRTLQRRVLTVLAAAIFVLAVYGLANAIANLKFGRYFFGKERCEKGEACQVPGHPFETRRFLGRVPFVGDLFYCAPCLAFWFGVMGSLWVLSPAAQLVGVWWKAMILDGLMASGATWLLHVAAEKLALGTRV